MKQLRCKEETCFKSTNGIFGWLRKGDICELIETKLMPHDGREWYKIKVHGCVSDGWMNPDDFDVVK